MATSKTGQDMSGWLWDKALGGSNIAGRSVFDPKTGTWTDPALASLPVSDDGGRPLRDQIANYLQQAGYQGSLGYDAFTAGHFANQLAATQAGVKPGGMTFDAQGNPVIDYSNITDMGPGSAWAKLLESAMADTSAPASKYSPDLQNFLNDKGLTLENAIHQTPGASQSTAIQRLIDSQGNPVAVDAYNNRYNASDRLGDATALAGAVISGYALGGLGGLWGGAGSTTGAAGGAAGGGGATLGGGASGAGAGGLTTQALPAGITQGLGLSNAAPIALAPSITGVGAATAGSAAALAAEASALGGGAAAGAAGGTGAATEGTYLDLLKSGEMGTIGGGAAGSSALDLIKAGGSGLLDAVGGAKNLAPVIGAIAGASQGGKTNTATSGSKLDPRMEQYLYGSGFGDQNSFLGAAQNWFNQNKSGTNADMTAGMNQLRNLYSSPEYTQGYQQMRGMGQGLLSQPIAGNPFTQGRASPGLLGPGMPPPQVGVGQPGMMYAGGTPGFYGQPEEQQTVKVPRNLLGIGSY